MKKKILKNSHLMESDIKYIWKDVDVFIGKEIDEKKIILDYFKSYEHEPNYATSAFVFDEVTKAEVDGCYNMGFEYDGYFWNRKIVYHFKKYNMPLSEEFISFVLSKSKNSKNI